MGTTLCEATAVRKLSFTGSSEVGRLLMAMCAPSLKKLSLELGGSAPFIVFDDADIEAAVDALRAKGLAAVQKKSSRTAAEGLVGVAVEGTRGVAVEVNSETDFVAKNETFQAFCAEVAEKLAANPDEDLEEFRTLQVAKIGENMTLRRVAALEVGKGVVATYVHNQVSEGLGKIGVLVALEFEIREGAVRPAFLAVVLQ